jgi:hypothetical protein
VRWHNFRGTELVDRRSASKIFQTVRVHYSHYAGDWRIARFNGSAQGVPLGICVRGQRRRCSGLLDWLSLHDGADARLNLLRMADQATYRTIPMITAETTQYRSSARTAMSSELASSS